jgi:hypothetical protein
MSETFKEPYDTNFVVRDVKWRRTIWIILMIVLTVQSRRLRRRGTGTDWCQFTIPCNETKRKPDPCHSHSFPLRLEPKTGKISSFVFVILLDRIIITSIRNPSFVRQLLSVHTCIPAGLPSSTGEDIWEVKMWDSSFLQGLVTLSKRRVDWRNAN